MKNDRPLGLVRQEKRLVTGHGRCQPQGVVYRVNGRKDWALIYTISGNGRFGHAGGEVVTRPNDIVLIRPDTLQDYGLKPPCREWELIWAHFHPEPTWRAWLEWSEVAPGLMHLSLGESASLESFRNAIQRMHRLDMSGLRLNESLAMNALEEAVLWCSTHLLRTDSAQLDPRVEHAREYLCRHLRDKIALDDVSESVGLSVSRLSTLFRQQIGMPLQQFLELQRLDRARQLLEITTLSIGQIAAEVGYDNPFYFTLRFKRFTGQSPRVYRKAHRSK